MALLFPDEINGEPPPFRVIPRARSVVARISKGGGGAAISLPEVRMRPIPDGIRPRLGDERGFVHKKLLGGISKLAGVASFIPGANIVSAVTGRLAGTGRTLPRTQTARVSVFSEAGKQFGRNLKFSSEAGPSLGDRFLSAGTQFLGSRFAGTPRSFGPAGIAPPQIPGIRGNGDCPRGTQRDPRGFCVSPVSPVGAAAFRGEAVAGQYGAAEVPGSQIVDRATCRRGMQLGNDGLCYNKSQISNKQRMWPAGRKPLLSGGDMRAISTAARAGRRLEGATKRLQRLGMMKKPTRRAVPAGHRAQLVHASDH